MVTGLQGMFKVMTSSGGVTAFRAVMKKEMDVCVPKNPLSSFTTLMPLFPQKEGYERRRSHGTQSYPSIGERRHAPSQSHVYKNSRT